MNRMNSRNVSSIVLELLLLGCCLCLRSIFSEIDDEQIWLKFWTEMEVCPGHCVSRIGSDRSMCPEHVR